MTFKDCPGNLFQAISRKKKKKTIALKYGSIRAQEKDLCEAEMAEDYTGDIGSSRFCELGGRCSLMLSSGGKGRRGQGGRLGSSYFKWGKKGGPWGVRQNGKTFPPHSTWEFTTSKRKSVC